jgi:peptidyl-prolyl cis-trans isomerase D
MAILEKLRVRAGLLLAIVIGLALLAFVLSDFLDSGGSLFTRSKYEIAEIMGKSIPYTDYEAKVQQLENIQKLQSGESNLDEETLDQIRTATWENMIQDMLLEKQYAKLGIEISPEELGNIITGENPHPAVAQLFTDRQTGILDRRAFNEFLQRVRNEEEVSDEKTYYLFLENEIERQRKNVKYLNLIRKGLFATKFEAQLQQNESSTSVDLNFVVKNFNSISDSAIKVSDSDLNKYYKENISLFKQAESRDIRYITFEVVPSEADFKAAEQRLNDISPDFEKSEDMIQFVNMESDLGFDGLNYSADQLSDTLAEVLFNASVGTTFGPYFTDNSYRISRLAAVNYLPDSVKARHILLRPTQANVQTIQKTADSLVNLIKSGSAEFEMLAMMYSNDGTAQSGGDLGWFSEGEMVKPFSDTCFFAEKGEVKQVLTQYGIHVVQITDQAKPVRKVQIATIVKNVAPSDATDQSYYVMANEFAGKNNNWDEFNKAIEESKGSMMVETALNLAPMDKRVNDLESPRQLVNWAYRAEEKDISSVYKFGNEYLVAVLDKVREEGPAPFSDVKADIMNRVRQQKKAEILVQKFNEKKQNAKSLEELASNMGVSVEPVSGLRFTSSTLGNAGIEPKVVAAACALEKNTLSTPIIGENGVYVLAVTNVTAPETATAPVDVYRNYVERNYAARTNYFAYEALKELAEIKDNRREFY